MLKLYNTLSREKEDLYAEFCATTDTNSKEL